MNQFLRSLVIMAAVLGVSRAQGVVIAQYQLNGSATSTDTQANSTADALTATGLGGLSYGTISAHQALTVTAGNTPSSIAANNNFYSFSVTAQSGFFLNLNGGNIQIQNYANYGGASFTIRSSLDNYTANLGGNTITAQNTWNSETINLSGNNFNNLSSITFHIYPTDASGGGSRRLYFDNIILNGIVAVPEPTTYAAGIFGGVFGISLLRRAIRKRRLS